MGQKVLIIWASAGGGHFSVMQALTAALKELDPTVEVSNLDAYARGHAGVLAEVPRLYPIVTLRYPIIWDTMYRATNSKITYTLSELPMRYLTMRVRRLAKLLKQQRPDLIINTAPALGNYIADAVKLSGHTVPIAFVVNDLANAHQGWVFPDAIWTSAPTDAVREDLINAGVPADRIMIGGMPIRKGFWEAPADRRALRDQLGLPQDKPVVLLLGGGDGADSLYHITIALLEANLPYHLVAITGRNQKLCDRLTEATQGQPITVRGFTSNMADWMWASDLLVTKAGPNSMAEAMQCGVPMVLTSWIPGQETANVHYAEENALGLIATTPEQVVETVQSILDHPELVEEMRQAIKRVHFPDSARTIAQMILDTLNSEAQSAGQRKKDRSIGARILTSTKVTRRRITRTTKDTTRRIRKEFLLLRVSRSK
jgi:1,2-diacylglycerol 3-beta-galactosyltransferase